MRSRSAALSRWPLTLTHSRPATSSKAVPSGASSPSQWTKVGEKSWRSQFWSSPGRGEDLGALVERLALERDPLAGAKHVLGRVEEAKADAALGVELADEARRLRDVGQHDGEVVVGRLAVALGVGVGLLVCVERERAVEVAGQPAAHDVVGVAVVAAAQEGGAGRQAALLDLAQAARPCVGVEEVALRPPGGDREDDHDREHDRGGRRRAADRDAGGQRAGDQRRDRRRRAEAQRDGVADEAPEMKRARVVGVLRDRRRGGLPRRLGRGASRDPGGGVLLIAAAAYCKPACSQRPRRGPFAVGPRTPESGLAKPFSAFAGLR